MSLQTYDFRIGMTGSKAIAAQGRYFYYLKGSTWRIDGGQAAAAGDQELRVSAGSTSITMMPGQSFRMPDDEPSPTQWTIRNSKGIDIIEGFVLIGEGDFNDNNTSNTSYVKLDASFANNVKVMNSGAGEAVPVSLVNAQVEVMNDAGNPLPVSVPAGLKLTNTTAERVPITLDPTQIIRTSGAIMSYTASYSATGASSGGVAIQMLSAAANVNGAVLNRFELLGSTTTNSNIAVLAKATAPANIADGAVLFSSALTSTTSRHSLDVAKDGQVQVPPGMAVWYISSNTDSASLRSALFTVL